MEIRIIETGELTSLNIYTSNGINWANDLILDVEPLKYNEDAEVHEMTQEQYDWWKEYIKDYESDKKEAAELAEELGIDESEIWEKYNKYHTCDYGDHHRIKQQIFEKLREEA